MLYYVVKICPISMSIVGNMLIDEVSCLIRYIAAAALYRLSRAGGPGRAVVRRVLERGRFHRAAVLCRVWRAVRLRSRRRGLVPRLRRVTPGI